VVSAITGSANAIDVHWLPGGGVPPQKVTLMEGGTAAKSFTDGTPLAKAAQLSSLGNYASYDLHVGNLPANKTFPQTLRVIGYWGGYSFASAVFGAATQSGQAGNAPAFTQSSYANGKFSLAWTGGASYTYYNMRWSAGTVVAPNASQTETGSGGNGSFSYRPPAPGPYSFMVEGCNRTYSFSESSCSKWSRTVTLYATVQPPPTAKSLNFPHMSSGDCEMQNATITFRSDGTGSFTAQVKTNHTHSGDVWHATMAARNAGNQDIVKLPTFDSMRMDDDHGYYQWNHDFEYDASQFPAINGVAMLKKC
jgi:hypothetical protein